MLSSTSSSPENCVQTSGDASGRPENASMRAGATTVGTASPRFATMPTHRMRLNQRPVTCALRLVMVISKSLQVLDDRLLVGVAQGRAVQMTLAAVAGDGGVVPEKHLPGDGRHGRDEADAFAIEE